MTDNVKDIHLPNSHINKLLKQSVPEGINISKDARTAINRSAAVFVMQCASFANMNANNKNRSTVQPDDIKEAAKELGYGQYIDELGKLEKKLDNESKKKNETESHGTLTDDEEIENDIVT
ncbi:hypothetical protein SNEBB_005395 [Seison nebaliae]|nr:hypothetical protein SNEBB_005395 [Seison nebaliae]